MNQQPPKRLQTISNFTLGKQIGVGTFSKVKVARHHYTNEQAVFKIIEKEKIMNEADQNRLNRELKIMRKVRHPNIIQLYEIIETKKYIYLVTEYATRGELFDHIVQQEKLTEFQACKFLHQLVDAVEYIHQLGIAHRDLKPENLLLDHKYNIKLADFGLSNLYARNTTLKTACGSPCYASPEMLKGQPYDGLKSDIWSLGVILYAMCFGFLPFDKEGAELFTQIRNGEYEIPPTVSEDLTHLIKSILEVDPEKRTTISEIRSHPFCRFSTHRPVPGIIVGLSEIPYEPDIQQQMKQLGLETSSLQEFIRKNKHNDLTCTYYLLLQRKLRINNLSLTSYYLRKINLIQRFSLVQKVKANIEKKQIQNKEKREKMQHIHQRKRAKTTEKKPKHSQDRKSSPHKRPTLTQTKRSGKKRQRSLSKGKKLYF